MKVNQNHIAACRLLNGACQDKSPSPVLTREYKTHSILARHALGEQPMNKKKLHTFTVSLDGTGRGKGEMGGVGAGQDKKR